MQKKLTDGGHSKEGALDVIASSDTAEASLAAHLAKLAAAAQRKAAFEAQKAINLKEVLYWPETITPLESDLLKQLEELLVDEHRWGASGKAHVLRDVKLDPTRTYTLEAILIRFLAVLRGGGDPTEYIELDPNSPESLELIHRLLLIREAMIDGQKMKFMYTIERVPSTPGELKIVRKASVDQKGGHGGRKIDEEIVVRPGEIKLGNGRERISLNQLAEYPGIEMLKGAERNELRRMDIQALAAWLTEGNNPSKKGWDEDEVVKQLKRALAMKQLTLNYAKEEAEHPTPEAWEDPDFALLFPSFGHESGADFKSAWRTAAVRLSILKGDEPLWVEGDEPEGYATEDPEELKKMVAYEYEKPERGRRYPWIGELMNRWRIGAPEGYEEFERLKKWDWLREAVKRPGEDVVNQLYRSYIMAEALRREGVELCKVSKGKRGAEAAYQRGLKLLAQAHARSLELSRQAIETQVLLTTGWGEDPTEDLGRNIENIGHKLAATAEVRGTGAQSAHHKSGRRQANVLE